VDYLVKPIAYPRFLKACQKAYETYLLHTSAANELNTVEAHKHFFIKSEGKYLKISFDNILYLESLKDYVFIHTAKQRHMVLISLSNAAKALPTDHFIRVHRSFIVALSKITSLEGNVLKIHDKEIPISKHLREEVFKKLIEGRLWKR
ncbi:MAG: LytTR family DNA-binding domain-containing protein, partial [Bacteroidota bacterium]